MKRKAPFLNRFIVWVATATLGISLPTLLLKGGFWLASAALLFSFLRIYLLEVKRTSVCQDLLAVAAGIGAATLLLTVSLPAAVAAFFLTQVIYELGFMETRGGYVPDRFQDSYKTAEHILKSFPR